MPGRMVGVIGANGAGKSALLRLLGGVGRPDEGTSQVHGWIGALFDLGAGFHPDLTRRENVFISGVISGLTRCEVASRFDDIVAFAELEEWIDEPLRTYSTGMQLRLAFAVATQVEPDILLIDEVLAVGDIAFQRKCLERIIEFKTRGCTILLVTQDPAWVARYCDEAIWLRDGKLASQGAAEVTAGQYMAERNAETKQRTPAIPPALVASSGQMLRANENRFGSQEMEISRVHLLNQSGQEVTEIASGDSLSVQIDYSAPQTICSPIFGITILGEDGQTCFESSNQATGLELSISQASGQVTLQIDRLDLRDGIYYIDPWIYEKDWRYAYDYHWHVYPLVVHSSTTGKGILQPPHRWLVEEALYQGLLPTLR